MHPRPAGDTSIFSDIFHYWLEHDGSALQPNLGPHRHCMACRGIILSIGDGDCAACMEHYDKAGTSSRARIRLEREKVAHIKKKQ